MQAITKFWFFLFLILPFTAGGQNYSNNPYTRFAIGDLVNSGFSYNRSMGGSAIALRPANVVNYLNPASYTSQDTLSFLFHAGVSGRLSKLSTSNEEDFSRNMNLEYLAMGFPITRWWKFSAGLVPYSRSQYHFLDYQEGIDEVAVEYFGKGGYNNFYFGSAFQPLKYLSFGFNASYFFGNLNRIRSVDIPENIVATTRITEDFTASDFHFQTGLQIHPEFTWGEKKHKFVLGFTYDFKADIDINYNASTKRYFPSVSTTQIDTFNIISDSATSLKLPEKLGIGISYNFNDKLVLTGEYSSQKFSQGIGLFNDIPLADYSSWRFGAEFVPAPLTERTRSKYYERMHYRIGFYSTNSYLIFGGQQISETGISVGIGLPWRNTQKLYTNTIFDLSYEYGIRGTTDSGLIQENFHRFTISVALFDYWFMKPKYD